ncbi:putative sodium/potassium/calcium exchanger [Natronolimnohabitans innermongolicus]|uniref:Uncharacterized protein n=1 Tax=Natronolimnohabitans innermongolicus JCM 12255 TaxID=1227499 RepID=L9XJ47_9EURY|nr:hypothetical protein [Natronolimnohabitans innermongolicus]ELY60683.1 hypothetical protein C493_04381 [Natronolimnohabitans innermongolicus JCM 12255]
MSGRASQLTTTQLAVGVVAVLLAVGLLVGGVAFAGASVVPAIDDDNETDDDQIATDEGDQDAASSDDTGPSDDETGDGNGADETDEGGANGGDEDDSTDTSDGDTDDPPTENGVERPAEVGDDDASSANGETSNGEESDGDEAPTENGADDAAEAPVEPAEGDDDPDDAAEDPIEEVEYHVMTPSGEAGESYDFGILIHANEQVSGDAELRVDGEVVDTTSYEAAAGGSGLADYGTDVILTGEMPDVEEPTEIPVTLEADHYESTYDVVVSPAADDGANGENGDDSDENGDDGENDDQWSDEERELAAEMIAQYYAGYEAGISQATDAGWATERNQIEMGESEPWPLEEWDDPQDAFEEGESLGAGDGAQPIEDEYRDKQG